MSSRPFNFSYVRLVLGTSLVLLVGVAVTIYFEKQATENYRATEHTPTSHQALSELTIVSSTDHYRGDISAPVKLIEYADTECPFCKSLQDTIDRLYAQYGPEGRVVFVYRHFPLGVWANSIPEAEALECAASQGGNETFFTYLETLLKATHSENKFSLDELPRLAKAAHLDVEAFKICLDSGRFQARVEQDKASGRVLGASKTPTLFIVAPDGSSTKIVGNKSFELLDAAIRAALSKTPS